MKYKTTEKHGFFNEGLEIFVQSDNLYYVKNFMTESMRFNQHLIKIWLKQGWVVEVEEKEFTKLDLVLFALYVLTERDNIPDRKLVDEWIKNK